MRVICASKWLDITVCVDTGIHQRAIKAKKNILDPTRGRLSGKPRNTVLPLRAGLHGKVGGGPHLYDGHRPRSKESASHLFLEIHPLLITSTESSGMQEHYTLRPEGGPPPTTEGSSPPPSSRLFKIPMKPWLWDTQRRSQPVRKPRTVSWPCHCLLWRSWWKIPQRPCVSWGQKRVSRKWSLPPRPRPAPPMSNDPPPVEDTFSEVSPTFMHYLGPRV